MINIGDSLEVKIKENYLVTIPTFFVESGVTHLNHFQTNILMFLFSVFSSTTYENETADRTQYCFPNYYYSEFFGLSKKTIPKRFKICADRLLNFKYTEDFQNWYSVFDSVLVDCGNLYVEVNKNFKQKYIEGLKKDKIPIYTKLKTITQLSQYEQKIYLMCRMFKYSGLRYKDNNMEQYLYQLGLFENKTAHIYNKLVNRYIKSACVHISDISDIAIVPTFDTKINADSGVRFVSYSIQTKKKSIIHSNKDAWNHI